MATGHNNDFAYTNTGDALVEFFSKAGSILQKGKKRLHYESPVQVDTMTLFKPAFKDDEYRSLQLAMWLRDCRGGAGVRSGFRDIIKWLGENNPSWIIHNLHLIPKHGRWDDLIALMDTPCEKEAVAMWVRAILDGDGLACKWAPREKNNKPVYNKLRKALKMGPKEFRLLLVEGTNVIETAMCADEWTDIEYNHVPSVAMARFANAFMKHDTVRFEGWKQSLADPKSENKVNASVLFPHDCIRTLRSDLGSAFKGGYYGWSYSRNTGAENFQDSELANAQFAALPDFMEGTNMRIISLCDFSASMGVQVAGSCTALDVSMALGLYCSDRLGEDNPFYRKFIPFSDDSRLVEWRNETFSIAAQKHNDGWVGSTNIGAALDQILDAANLLSATNEQMPTCLLILSDMQWNGATNNSSSTAVEAGMKKWEKAGYNRPSIVYWNLNPYLTTPATVNHKNVALVSGFSPSIMGAILSGEDFTPRGVMERTIAKYEIVDPRG